MARKDQVVKRKERIASHQEVIHEVRPVEHERRSVRDEARRAFRQKMRLYGELFWDESNVPGGMKYAWKTTHVTMDKVSTDHLRALQRGWSYVPADRHPEYKTFSPNDMFKGYIWCNCNILMEIPEEDYYEDENAQIEEAEQEYFDMQRSVNFGHGNPYSTPPSLSPQMDQKTRRIVLPFGR